MRIATFTVRAASAATAAAILVSATVASAQSTALPVARFIDRQDASEIRSSNLIGVVVKNKQGETIGDIVDVIMKPNGQATAVILGVGGVLGLGEKNVAVPYEAVSIATGDDQKRTATVDAELAALKAAPAYVSERTTFEKVQDGVAKLAATAKQKAIELKDQMSAPASDPAPSK